MNNTLFSFCENKTNYIYSSQTGIILESDSNKDLLKNFDENYLRQNYKELFCDDNYENSSIDIDKLKYEKLSLNVFSTDRCNLNCIYCYESKTSEFKKNDIDYNLFINVLKRLLHRFINLKKLTITFFGGEPLLNLPFIEECLLKLHNESFLSDINIKYSLTTNGTLISDKILNLIKRYNIGITVSIDGDEKIHDRQRPFHNGKGSYRTIMDNIKSISNYCNPNARVTMSNFSIDYINLTNTLEEIGFQSVYLSPATIEKPYKLSDYSDLRNTIDSLGDFYLDQLKMKNKLPIIYNFTRGLHTIHNGNEEFFPCGAGISLFSISTKGEIYLCHRFNNIKQFKFGDIYSFNKEKQLNFINKHVIYNRNNTCNNCFAKNICGGSCYQSSYQSNGHTLAPSSVDCFFTKELMKKALRIYTSLNDSEQTLFDDVSEA